MAVGGDYNASSKGAFLSGDADDDTIIASRDAAGTILGNGGAVVFQHGTPTVTNTVLIEIIARDGNDTIILDDSNGALPSSEVFGGFGNDVVIGSGNEDVVFGQGGNDTLVGKGGNDELEGGDGNDTLTGGDGEDQMFGEAGDDRMIWNPGDDSDLMEGGDGTDTAEVNGGNGAEQFTITADGSRVRFDRVDPAPFSLDIGTTENLVLNANGGDDVITAGNGLAGLVKLTIDGGTGNDTITGGDGDDMLLGGDQDDVITGGRGDDAILLGAGNDKAVWNAGDGTDLVEGQDGIDTLEVNGGSGAEVFTILANGQRVRIDQTGLSPFTSLDVNDVENIVINANDGDDTITAGNGLAALTSLTINGGAGNDTITGGDGADVLLGGDGNDKVTGGKGGDVALLGEGNDTFLWNPGDGSDIVEGQGGVDTLVFNGANINEQINISANGTRALFTRDVANIVMDINKVERIEFKALGGVDTVTVNDLSGTDVTQVAIDLAAAGGGGDGQPDTIVINGTGGNDTISLSIVDGKLVVDGLASQIVVENFEPDNDTIRIVGLAGDDVIDASGLGADGPQLVLEGGEGNDILIGGGRSDVLSGGVGDDVLIGNAGVDVLDGGTGENLVLQNGSAIAGNVAALFGTDGNDTLTISRTAAGAIIANGGAVELPGAPTVADTAVVQVFGNAGNDVMTLDETNGALPRADLFGGAGNDTVTGGSGSDQIFGGAGNDTITGGSGIDFLFGGAGNDVLTGGAGDDLMFGEAGDDRMVWNPGDGTDLAEGGGGIDTAEVNGGNGGEVFTATANGTRVRFDRVSPAPFSIDIGTTEKLVVNMNGGDDTFSATGNIAAMISVTVDGGAGNDTILGSNGADLLLGGDGNDFIDGNQGNDVALLGAGDDVFHWDPGDGSDVVEGQGGFDTLEFNGANVTENIDISANGEQVRFFRDVANIVMDNNDVEHISFKGLAGADNIVVKNLSGTDVQRVTIDGGADNDTVNASALNAAVSLTVQGGAGADVMTGGAGSDTLSYADSALGVDINLATGAASGGDATGDVFSFFENIIGSSLADTLAGDAGDNVLAGRNGDDHMSGGAGHDTAVFNVNFASAHVGIAGDTVIIDSAEGHDDLTAFETFRFADGAYRLNDDHTGLVAIDPPPPVTPVPPKPVANDLNGDGHGDILWQTDGGQLAGWEMNGVQVGFADFTRLGQSSVGLPGMDWHVVDSGDFDGDGKSDLLWRTDGGAVAIWEMDGTHIKAADFTKLGSANVGAPGADWHVLGAADFDGDGKSDLLWRTDGGALAIWEMNGTQIKGADFTKVGSATVGAPGADWHLVGTSDFDGDGKSDLLWRTDSGALAIWEMNGTQVKAADYLKLGGSDVGAPGRDWHVLGTGDFDGDGKGDLLWQTDSGALAIWEMNGIEIKAADYLTVGQTQVGLPGADWHFAGTSDYNGDGKNDLLWHTDGGALAIWQMDGTHITAADYTKLGSADVGAPGSDWHVFQHHYDLV